MKAPQNLCLSISILALTSSALAGSFDRPAPLIPNDDRNLKNEEVFKEFHFFMPETGLPPRQKSIPPMLPGAPAIFPLEFRTIDGTGNNLNNPTLGSANTPFLRTTTNAYGDGLDTPAGAGEPGTRDISNAVCAHGPTPAPIAQPDSSFWWAWGQFIDHDMEITPIAVPTESLPIPVPTCDPVFDHNCTGTATISFSRSAFVHDVNLVRQQLNVNTHWIDGSAVYGSDTLDPGGRADALRAHDGLGHLLADTNNMLPFNTGRLVNEPNTSPNFRIAGDVRVNENSPLTALQTLFMREHNFWADHFHAIDPTLDDDGLYFRARAIVGAEIQKINYTDFLPFLIGKHALTPYAGYNENVDPSIANVFGAAAWRWGHTLLNLTVLELDANNQPIGNPRLNATFFHPTQITTLGIEPFLRGLAHQKGEEIDRLVVDGVRNFTHGNGGGGFDLPALNMQRGRDHGLPRFNQVRLDYGLPAYTSFSDINPDPATVNALESIYATVDDIDAWLGLIAEAHVPNAAVGPTLVAILKDQFERLRDGDRFWYEAYLDPTTLAGVQQTTLADIIIRNTTITTEIQRNVLAFVAPTPPPTPTGTPSPTPTLTPTPSPTP